MTYALDGKIVFHASRNRKEFEVYRFSEFTIESSWRKLTDTAEIVLPRKTADYNRFALQDIFKGGDPVSILAGYDGESYEEFSGYIAQIEPGIPLTMRLEDEMYHLKRYIVSISKKNCGLKELLIACADGREVDCNDTNLGTVRYDSVYASVVLEDLKKQGIYCFFRNKVLTAMKVCDSNAELVSVMIERTADESLKQKNVEKVHVKVISHRKFGKNLKYECGEKGGVSISLEQNGLNQYEIEVIAKDAYKKAKTPGLDGEVTLFGVPRVKHGMRMALNSVMYPELKGTYYINAVKKTMNKSDGFKQIATLGDKAS